ncbi:MAG: hypothetical protein P9E24_11110 [Candidatus Competibacter sp.]|nr:hypothetical protein [Candidatus Competibacter sp.]MDG4582633.1 hypothetical protein [Candidatus Competibacter sp.]
MESLALWTIVAQPAESFLGIKKIGSPNQTSKIDDHTPIPFMLATAPDLIAQRRGPIQTAR